ncbi:MAG: PAS domain S-box protein [Calditrichae bacterium]|nr:PAS domain S-box protein [Calditrichia bacterium]
MSLKNINNYFGRNVIITLFILAIVFTTNVLAQSSPLSFVFETNFKSASVNSYLEYYFEETDSLGIEQISSEAFQNSFTLCKSFPNFGYRNKPIWLKLRLNNNDNNQQHPMRILYFEYPNIHYIDFYHLDGEGNVLRKNKTGVYRPLSSRGYLDENFVFFVSVPKNEEHTLYFRISSEAPLILTASMYNMDYYLKKRFSNTLISGIFLGFFLLVIAYFTFIYFQVKDKSFIYLVLAGASLVIFYLSLTGFGYLHIWTDMFLVNKYSLLFAICMTLNFYILFSTEFLAIHTYYPELIPFRKALLGLFTLLAVSSPFISFITFDKILDVLLFTVFCLIIFLSYATYKKGFKPAKMFFAGQLVLSVFVIYNIFVELGWVPGNIISEFALNFGILFALAIWSQSLAEKIGILRIEKDKALQNILENEKKLQKSVKRLEVIRAFHETFSDVLNLEVVYERLYQYGPDLLQNFGVDRISLLLWDEENKTLVSDQYIGVEHKNEQLVSGRQNADESISGKCFSTKKPVIIEDCSDQDIIPLQYVDSLSLKSTIAIPVFLNNLIIGVLRFDSTRQSGVFSEQDADFYLTLANHLGIIIGNAQLFKERQIAEKEIRESEERFRRFFEDMGDAVFVTRIEGENIGQILEVNPAAEKQTGYGRSELIGMNIAKDLSVKDTWNIDPDEFPARLSRGEHVSFTEKKRKKDETEYWTDVVLTCIDYKGEKAGLSINHDISERRNLEEQLQHSQKMEAIGQLAGGVAHDFNNILTIISGFSSLLLQEKDLSPAFVERIEHINKASLQAEALTRQLLTFSRKDMIQKRLIDVNQLINDSIKILKRLIGTGIEVNVSLLQEKSFVKADPHQMEQILMNLILNARDAINAKREQFNREIKIQTNLAHFDKKYMDDSVEINKGRYLLLTITDNGIGMDPEIVKKIFEPFYTTKGIGKGTGLGLSTVYGIVKQNNAHINVYSEKGKGTTFKIYWPVSETEGMKKQMNKLSKKIQKGTEYIFIVEDDSSIRRFMKESLERIGYKIKVAESGAETLELLEKDNTKPDLLITDLILPGINGYDLSNIILNKFPGLDIIYTSGYVDGQIVDKSFFEKDINFLQKPFSLNTLSEKIREILDKNKNK